MAWGNSIDAERQSRHRRRASHVPDGGDRVNENREIDREALRRMHAEFYDGDGNKTSGLVRRPAVAVRSRPHNGHRRTESDVRIRSKRHSSSSEDSADYVYTRSSSRTPKSRTLVSESNRGTDSVILDSHTIVAPENVGLKKEKTIYIDGKTPLRSSKHGSRKSVFVEKTMSPEPRPTRRSSVHRPRSAVLDDSPSVASKSTSGRRPRTGDSRPPVTRAQTQPNPHTHRSRSGSAPPPSTGTRERRNSFLGSVGNVFKAHTTPDSVKLVTCSTCLSDGVPKTKTAKLNCGHRMCNSCMKRVFKLSLNDPAHMPPKCCTAEHIPIKHVEKLFDLSFKKQWNKKYQEYTTKNRIYCPGRKCGEWIRPRDIHTENGRKCGKCSNCKMKVCGTCNGKWHGSRECVNDDETNRLLEQAAKAGWQRCYNCRAMVELKEGCNHMTCRCNAQFCMCCGSKWKTCNCPWFNYDLNDSDILTNMRIPLRPRAYTEGPINRRAQERDDERLARRLSGMPAHPNPSTEFLDYNGGIGEIEGVGNAGAHFMNESYVRTAHNILGMGLSQANAAANYVMGVRNEREGRPSMRSGVESDGVIPRIRTNDRYPTIGPQPTTRGPPPSATAGRSPMADTPVRRISLRRPAEVQRSPVGRPAPEGKTTIVVVDEDGESTRRSILAGLNARGTGGSGRVNAWRAHVGAGVLPKEGVLNVVEN